MSRVAIKLNGGWGARTERFEIQASTDGTTFTTVVAATDYTFDPAADNNTVDASFPAAGYRYLRVVATANTGWPAAQIAELEVYQH